MAQLTLYMDEALRRRVAVAARRANLSVSRWVVRAVTENLEQKWPDDYFSVFGSLKDVDFEAPSPLDPKLDLPREDIE